GASKLITIKVKNSKSEEDAKQIGLSIANSNLVKTAIAGEESTIKQEVDLEDREMRAVLFSL
ncbi:bifunctional ornithine acetyltransferase/N-acetylglutamate synthase, partial [Pelagibacterales bacterium SAG-MED07]|nr:bifunctional ornithine acetyltransferase/N-acetylglutamate synthase [Pelagibacterales bacterium SAG-MED07]